MRPVVGSMRPSTLAIWPVYQIVPSSAASGSCGREPGVGSVHSRNVTCAGPARTAPCGLDFSGKFSARYADERRELIVRQLRADVPHHVKNRSPVFSAIAGAEHAADLMAIGAGALQDLLAGALGERGLAVSGRGQADEKRNQQGGKRLC